MTLFVVVALILLRDKHEEIIDISRSCFVILVFVVNGSTRYGPAIIPATQQSSLG